MKMLLNLQMVMHEPWKASALEVYLLRTTDGSVPRGLDPYTVTSVQYLAEILGSLYLLVGFSMILLSNIHFLYVGA